eukprot:17603-Heterococcus_DN1.PRE.1
MSRTLRTECNRAVMSPEMLLQSINNRAARTPDDISTQCVPPGWLISLSPPALMMPEAAPAMRPFLRTCTKYLWPTLVVKP